MVKLPAARRNRAYAATHQALIEGAVRLMAQGGSLSVSALARSLGIDRTTIYYHFPTREGLVDAVNTWAGEQLARGFAPEASQRERIDFISRFVLDNPHLIRLWIDRFLSPGDIRTRYPKWDELVAAIAASLGPAGRGDGVDAEVYCTFLLAGAIIGPHVFAGSVRPDLDADTIVARFRAEQQRMLRRDRLLRE